MSGASESKNKVPFQYIFGEPSLAKSAGKHSRRGSIIIYRGKKYTCLKDGKGNPSVVKDDDVSMVRRFISDNPAPEEFALYVKIDKSTDSGLQHEFEITRKVHDGKEVVWYEKNDLNGDDRLITLEKKGQDLGACLKKILKTYSYGVFFNLIITVLEKLDDIHKKDICHGDLHVNNIKIDKDSESDSFKISILDYGESCNFGENIGFNSLFLSKNIIKFSMNKKKSIYARLNKMPVSNIALNDEDIETYFRENMANIRKHLIQEVAKKNFHIPREVIFKPKKASPAYDIYIFLSLVSYSMRVYAAADKYRGIYKVMSSILALGLDEIGSVDDCIQRLEKVKKEDCSDKSYSAFYASSRDRKQANADREKVSRIFGAEKVDLNYIENSQSVVVFFPKTNLFYFLLNGVPGVWHIDEAVLIFARVSYLVDFMHERGVVNVLSKRCDIFQDDGGVRFTAPVLDGHILKTEGLSESKDESNNYKKSDQKKLALLFIKTLKPFVSQFKKVSVFLKELDDFANEKEDDLRSILISYYLNLLTIEANATVNPFDFKQCLNRLEYFTNVIRVLIRIFKKLKSMHNNIVGFMPDCGGLLFTRGKNPVFSRFSDKAMIVDADALVQLRGERKGIRGLINSDILILLAIIQKAFRELSEDQNEKLEITRISSLFSKQFSSAEGVLTELKHIVTLRKKQCHEKAMDLLFDLCAELPDPKDIKKLALMRQFKRGDSESKEKAVKLSLSAGYSKLFFSLIMQRTGGSFSFTKTTGSALCCLKLLNLAKFTPLRHFLFASEVLVDYQSLYGFTGKHAAYFFQTNAEKNLEAIAESLGSLSQG